MNFRQTRSKDASTALLPETFQFLKRAILMRKVAGAQVYVSRRKSVVANFGLGLAGPDVPMTADSLLPWWCATKPLIGVTIWQLWKNGSLDLDAPVSKYLPEFPWANDLTIRLILSHRVQFSDDPPAEAQVRPGRDRVLKLLHSVEVSHLGVNGQDSRYSHWFGWAILGEILHRTTGLSPSELLRSQVFLPLAMKDCWLGLPHPMIRRYGHRIAVSYLAFRQATGWHFALSRPGWIERGSISNGGCGPAKQLGLFYESLLDASTSADRSGIRFCELAEDPLLNQENCDNRPRWEFGFLCQHQAFGRYCSQRTIGHGILDTTITYVDLEFDLVVVVLFNTICEWPLSAGRNLDLSDAIYRDLGLVGPKIPVGEGRSETSLNPPLALVSNLNNQQA
jgi:CubicO group peptidase (beta-lactamase class C family)